MSKQDPQNPYGLQIGDTLYEVCGRHWNNRIGKKIEEIDLNRSVCRLQSADYPMCNRVCLLTLKGSWGEWDDNVFSDDQPAIKYYRDAVDFQMLLGNPAASLDDGAV
ncbi:MAG: hypothetical protein HQL53_11305 [Magnetococcales bacterium]|nr:hypothetical protein [Magnetococcales bacterium]